MRGVQIHRSSLPSQYPRRMIDLGSIAGLRAHDHQLAAYCPRCDAWRVLPLGERISQGKRFLRLPLRARCRNCGAIRLPCDACCHGSSRRRVAELAWSNICASCSLCFWVGRLRATRCWYVHSFVSACHVASTLLWWQPISVTGTGDALLTRQHLSQT